jgi:cysteine sulfinate desulfinase
MTIDIEAIRQQFPAIQSQEECEQPIVYLDSAATAQKPQTVIDTLTHYYSSSNANVHRGSHSLTASATSQFESARETVRQFINAQSINEIVWTRGATEAINLIAQSYARNTLVAGDEIIVCEMEHHANIVPWQIVAQQTGATIVKLPIKPDCTIDLDEYKSLLNTHTKIVTIGHISNVTGTRHPIEEMIQLAKKVEAITVIDGAQGIIHETVDVQKLDADFYCFSGHKLYGPTGIGVLYGKLALLDAMPPWHGGGKMVQNVSFNGTTFAKLPGKFEAGTPNIAGALALASAIRWLNQFDRTSLENHVIHLQKFTAERLSKMEDIQMVGYQSNASVLSFIMDGVHHQDVATLLDQQGIAIRSGHHCAHPLMEALNVNGTVRVSFAIYNNLQDAERFLAALDKAVDIL